MTRPINLAMSADTSTQRKEIERPTFYTVPEAARLLRVDSATLYRAIRQDAFPAVRVRTRYVIPARAVAELAERAAESGSVVDVAEFAAQRRMARDFERAGGGAW
ncbi:MULTISPECIES: helix-turn-helix domain-containing protein [Actinoalloteichus]|uniref:DNA-binding protein, excisionase family n=1 Tax=Actinoalloteichus fjordicus TaxID=1612552 RepID=A0AAC9LHB7_9PSEU|nr:MULTISPECIES: helix-turn-helix domain-containing protein [Actinoalloteichus]APU17788.1 DNA-binding protein, excisionase family [Actinoalloteichus fjordicus]APU23867.1 DNA-binding protein, excisionase family [Actinoalloteichus sp. GBA129-24]